jgi:hypothetical protein
MTQHFSALGCAMSWAFQPEKWAGTFLYEDSCTVFIEDRIRDSLQLPSILRYEFYELFPQSV